MLLKKLQARGIIVFCLLCTTLLLPFPAAGYQQHNKQTLRIIIERVQTNYYILEADKRNDLRLVLGYEDPNGGQFFAHPEPSCGRAIRLDRGVEKTLDSPLIFEFDIDLTNVNEVKILYWALEENNNPDRFPPCQDDSQQTLRRRASVIGAAKTVWTLVQVGKFIVENFAVDRQYGEGEFILSRTNNWNENQGLVYDQSNGPTDLLDLLKDPRDAKGVLKLGYRVELTNSNPGQNPNPNPPPIPDPPPPNPTTSCNGYTVQDARTLFDIAAQLQVNPHDLRVINNIPLYPYPPLVAPGQCLQIPGQTSPPPGPENPLPLPGNVSIEQAIREYYSLIRQGNYAATWSMSAELNLSRGIDFSRYVNGWNQSGPAEIVYFADIVENTDTAMAMFRLYYPNSNAIHGFRFEFKRDLVRGHERFGHWVFVRGTQLY